MLTKYLIIFFVYILQIFQ